MKNLKSGTLNILLFIFLSSCFAEAGDDDSVKDSTDYPVLAEIAEILDPDQAKSISPILLNHIYPDTAQHDTIGMVLTYPKGIGQRIMKEKSGQITDSGYCTLSISDSLETSKTELLVITTRLPKELSTKILSYCVKEFGYTGRKITLKILCENIIEQLKDE